MRSGRRLFGPTVAEAMERPYNNFTLLRLALALAVVVSHAFSVTTGQVAGEPLYRSTGFSLGEHAVNGFFAISGFLVTMSFDRRGWRDYLIARLLRIVPGFVVATLVVGFVVGALLTRLPLSDYLRDASLWRFLGATLSEFKSNTALPGVFETNPFRFPMGTVWTLRYEVFCYAGVLVLGLAGLLRSPRAAIALVAGLFIGLAGLELSTANPPKGVETALRLPLIFAFGGALYLLRQLAPVSGALLVGLAALTWLFAGTFLYKPLLFVASAYGVLWLAMAPNLSHPALDLKADLSYGTYLYGWPIQQVLTALWPAATSLALLVPSMLITLALAALSWFLIEKPALAVKARTLGRRTLRTIEPAAP